MTLKRQNIRKITLKSVHQQVITLNQSRTKVVQGAKKRHLGPLFEESVPTYPILVLWHPPFFQKTTNFIYNQKSVSDRNKPLLVCEFLKFWQNKKCKKGKSPLNIHIVAVWKNKNENLSKFDDSMSNYLTYNLTWSKYNLT